MERSGHWRELMGMALAVESLQDQHQGLHRLFTYCQSFYCPVVGSMQSSLPTNMIVCNKLVTGSDSLKDEEAW